MAKVFDSVARLLVIVGAANWGLVAIARFDLVATVFGLDFGQTNVVSRVVYGLVGASAVWLVGRLALARPDDRSAMRINPKDMSARHAA